MSKNTDKDRLTVPTPPDEVSRGDKDTHPPKPPWKPLKLGGKWNEDAPKPAQSSSQQSSSLSQGCNGNLPDTTRGCKGKASRTPRHHQAAQGAEQGPPSP